MSFTDAPDFDTEARQKDGAHPRFYMFTRPNPARSEKEGRPQFDDVEMVEILIPGDRLNSPHQIVGETHKKRWPKQYAAFQEKREAPTEGTPLDQLPGITGSRVEELRYFHIRTIEQLAGMPDDLLMKAAPMDGRAMRDRATRWVAATEGAAGEEKLAAENRELQAKMSLMEAQMGEFKTLIQGLQAQLSVANGGAAVTTPPET